MIGAVVAVPFLAAALLAVVPERADGWVGFGAALLAFALACALALAGQAGALGAALALLATFVAATAAWSAVHDPRPAARAGPVGARWRRAEGVLFQAMLGGTLLATLADNLALGWIGLEAGTVAAALAAALPRTRSAVAAGWRRFLVCGAALGLVLAGIAVLAFAASAALIPGPVAPDPATIGWGGLARAAPAMRPALLDLAFCLLVAGWGTIAALVPLQSWFTLSQAEGEQADSAVATACIMPMLLLNAALANLLRLRAIMAACPGALAPGPVLVALGLASVLVSALLMTAPQGARRLLAVSTVGQSGIAAAAFGLGGDAAFAGVLHLVLHTLAKSALLQGVGRAGSSRAALLLAAGLAVAGLPPAGVFVSEFLVLAEATRQAPLVAAPLAAGIIAAASALMAWLRRLLLDPAAAGAESVAPPAALLGAWANLALALVLALAMPGPVLALLRAAAR